MWPAAAPLTEVIFMTGCCLQAARLHSSWADVQAEVSRAIAAYDSTTSGPTKWPRLTVFLQQQYGHMVAEFMQKIEASAEKRVS